MLIQFSTTVLQSIFLVNDAKKGLCPTSEGSTVAVSDVATVTVSGTLIWELNSDRDNSSSIVFLRTFAGCWC